jgi:hypothetical protein
MNISLLQRQTPTKAPTEKMIAYYHKPIFLLKNTPIQKYLPSDNIQSLYESRKQKSVCKSGIKRILPRFFLRGAGVAQSA